MQRKAAIAILTNSDLDVVKQTKLSAHNLPEHVVYTVNKFYLTNKISQMMSMKTKIITDADSANTKKLVLKQPQSLYTPNR